LNIEVTGGKGVRRLTAQLKDNSGLLDGSGNQLGAKITGGQSYLVYGRAGFFKTGHRSFTRKLKY
jgi:hypothetical protein